MSDLERRMRLADGPLRLPRSITDAQRTIRLFMQYLKQSATQAAILNAAGTTPFGNKETREAIANAIDQLNRRIGVPRDHKGLCRLVAFAPQLKQVRYYAGFVRDPDILPEAALIPQEVIQACLATYHHWVEVSSRQPR